MAREIIIGGMTYDTYDQDEDPTGAIGHALAEARYQREGLNFDGSINGSSERKYWEGIVRVALRRFPELQRGERIHGKELSAKLKELREYGYQVKPYSRMNAADKWNYIGEIRREIVLQARHHCPEVLDEIMRQNEQAREEGKYLC